MTDEQFQREREALLNAARQEQASSELASRVMTAGRTIQRRKKFKQMSMGAGALALAAATLFVIHAQQSETLPEVAADEATAEREQVPASERPVDPCANPYVATGTDFLLDDFENAQRGVVPADGRVGHWILMDDQDNNIRSSVKKADALPENLVSDESEFAFHMKGPLLREWGQTFEFEFEQPGCYDATSYGGIKFRAVGKARFQFAAREVDNIPVDMGGLCEKDCWNSHVKVIDSTDEWQTFVIRWEDLRRRGYDSRPLDTTRLHSIQFLVHPEDTPFDFWIDDVEFLPAKNK